MPAIIDLNKSFSFKVFNKDQIEGISTDFIHKVRMTCNNYAWDVETEVFSDMLEPIVKFLNTSFLKKYFGIEISYKSYEERFKSECSSILHNAQASYADIVTDCENNYKKIETTISDHYEDVARSIINNYDNKTGISTVGDCLTFVQELLAELETELKTDLSALRF